MLKLSPKEARRLAVISQGLHTSKPFGAGKNAVARCIDQLGYVQIDTISVINRSHHHTFWTRVPSYREQHLDALQKEGRILEYWAHAAAYLPMQDYRYCLPYMHAIASGQKHWRTPDKKAMKAVLDRIRSEGPLMTRDFEHRDRDNSEWGWNWKPAKVALEQLFIEGKVIASHRVGFQKVYDLPERVLPAGLDISMPSRDEYMQYLIRRAIRAHGLVSEAEIGYLRKGMKDGIRKNLQVLAASGEIIPVQVALNPMLYYSTAETIEKLAGKRLSGQVSLLSPFDNAVIQRKRVQQLFDMDFQIECFVPAPKRRYGYYCLPILYGADIVGRLDPKADRKNCRFLVQSLHIEKKIRSEESFAGKLASKLRQVANFNGCDQIGFRPDKHSRIDRMLADLIRQRDA